MQRFDGGAHATLLDERDIVRALSHFARIADGKCFDDLGDVFADDLVFDYGSGRAERGLDALRQLMSRHLDRCGGTQHLIGSIIVDVAGDTAVSRAYVQAPSTVGRTRRTGIRFERRIRRPLGTAPGRLAHRAP